MVTKIRPIVFETNSSATHSLTICGRYREEGYEKLKLDRKGQLVLKGDEFEREQRAKNQRSRARAALKAEDSWCISNLAGKLKDVNDIKMSYYRYDHNKSLPCYVFLSPDEIQIKQFCADIAKFLE